MRINDIQKFAAYLETEGRSKGTVEKYRRDVRAFAAWLDDLDLEEASAWREHLLEQGYAPVTINSRHGDGCLRVVANFLEKWPKRS